MKKLLILLFVVTIAGCANNTVPVTLKWPTASDEMLAPPTDLTPLPEDKRTLTDMIENANDNFAQYYLLKERVETWIQWYNTNKNIYGESK